MKSYTYNPAKIPENGRDKMRFELGDTMVEGEAETCALTDEEYNAVLASNFDWQRAKLACLSSILHRFMYEVDTEVGQLSLSLRQRTEMWKTMYDELKKEVTMSNAVPLANPHAVNFRHYFYEGLHDNPKAGGGPRHVFPSG